MIVAATRVTRVASVNAKVVSSALVIVNGVAGELAPSGLTLLVQSITGTTAVGFALSTA